MKKGFTLIELLAVIVVIAVVATIATPTVLESISSARRSAFKSSANNVVSAVEFACQLEVLNEDTVTDVYNFENGVSTPLLNINGKLPTNGTAIVDPNCNVILNVTDGQFTATKTSLDFTITVVDGDQVGGGPINYTVYADGTAVYFNPNTGASCTSGEAVSTPGTKNGCMKWYVFGDGGSSVDVVNLLLDHNTDALMAWNSTGSNISGPVQVLADLQNSTSSWAGVPTRTDSYTVNNGTANYTINYNTYKARLITAEEISDITGNSVFDSSTSPTTAWFYFDSNTQTQTATSIGASNYAWLFDYTLGCTSNGCDVESASTYGYWTATSAYNSSSQIWYVRSSGRLTTTTSSSTSYGVRPVITILKSSI
jgi:type IV pilus assembly protein PilA